MPKHYTNHSHSTSSTNLSNLYLEVEAIQIDTIWFKPLTIQEKRRGFEEGLCLYCGKHGHKAINCYKKPYNHTLKMKSATTPSNVHAIGK